MNRTKYTNASELCTAHGCTDFAQLGRQLYKCTPCGPWLRLVLTENRHVYYEDAGAADPLTLTDPDVIGVEIGSIVEGSDVEIGPEFLRFPFTSEEWNATIARVDEEADFYWKRDNGEFFTVTSRTGRAYYAECLSINPPKTDGMPARTAAAFRAWYAANSADLPELETPVKVGSVTITRNATSDWIF